MHTRSLIFGFACLIFVIIVLFGAWLFTDPYLFAGEQKAEGFNLWAKGANPQALIFFNFTSRGLITANFPINVTTRVMIVNQSLLSSLTGKSYVYMEISGTYAYPIQYGSLGINDGLITLQYDGTNGYRGTAEIVFPYTGDLYYFSIFALNSKNEMSPPIYTMNVTDVGHAIPQTFVIDEGYAARTSFVQQNENTALSITIVGFTGLTIILAIFLEYRKRDSVSIEKMVAELRTIAEELNQIRRRQNQQLDFEQKHRKN